MTEEQELWDKFDEVTDLLREAGFDEIKGKEGGLQMFVRALKAVRFAYS